LSGDVLEEALLSGGVLCTIDALEARFQRHLQELARGMDLASVRVVVE
jgi:hypothetical protein